jgi:hypothetical protein
MMICHREKRKVTLVRLICRRAKTARALKSTPGPSSNEKTILVWISRNKLIRKICFSGGNRTLV